MIFIKRFLLMIQFLTTIPLPVKLDVRQEDFGKGLIFAPIVGVVLGGILAGFYHILNLVFTINITVIVLLAIYILLTGGLHFDGLGDTFDGLFSSRPKERILEIMRDSRVGTNAVLAITSLLLLDWSLLTAISPGYLTKVLILMPVAGRIGSLIGAGVSVYARSGEGLGRSFIDHCGTKEITAGLVIYFLIFYITAGNTGLLTAIFPVAAAFLLVKFFSRKIGGATGDILGAVCELNQMLFLALVFIFQVNAN